MNVANRFVLASLGTLGDLDPLLALGVELRRRGHEVAVGTSENLCQHARETGFDAFALAGDLSGITANPLAAILEIRKSLGRQLAALEEKSEGAAAVIGSGFPLGAPTAADIRGIPYIYLAVSPTYLPEAGLLPYIGSPAPQFISRLGWGYQKFSYNAMFRSALNAYRKTKQATPTPPVFRAVFQPQRRMIAAPKALAGSTMPFFAPGFLRVAAAGECPAEATRFFDAGEAPVVLAFGSSRIANASALTRHLIDAARECGRRTLVASSWSDREIGALPPDVCRAPYAPYRALFERAALVVHHGGAGTLAIALASGRPQAILPGFADQSYWARKACELGVAPAPLPRAKVTKEKARELIREALTNPAYAKRAAEVAATDIAENGAARAATWVEEAVE